MVSEKKLTYDGFNGERITKLKKILKGFTGPPFTPEEYMTLYTTIYNLCNTRILSADGSDNSSKLMLELYTNYRQVFEVYIHSDLLPCLEDKIDEFMLRELVKKWEEIIVIGDWLSGFFAYLQSVYVSERIGLPSLTEIPVIAFCNLFFKELYEKVRDALIALIDKEREGEKIDGALMKKVLEIFVQIGMEDMEFYQQNFEEQMISDTGFYYSRKASSWILQDSRTDYMIKAELCLEKEKDPVSRYLHWSSEPKLIERVQQELLVVHWNQLIGNEQSGCRALIREESFDDLSRIFRLYLKYLKD